jgi:pimeloyl-ACP methyl ester carboxylesterase
MSTTESMTSDQSASGANIGSQLTAKNQTAEVDGDIFVYRRFGNTNNSPPLLCLQHFRGNLDFWDPNLVDRIARDREVILLANRGVGASTGVVPDNVADMARDVRLFLRVLGLEQVDILGFSLGGHIAQELALMSPRLVRRLVLAGTGPQGGPGLHRWSDDVYAHACADEITTETALNIFFSGSEDSRAKGMAYLGRTQIRQEGRDEPTDFATRDAQFAALTAWGIPDASKLNRLAGITQPTFVAIGDNDTMMPTRNSRLLAETLPNAHLRIYPDANHGFLNQYPELFGDHVRTFLNAL